MSEPVTVQALFREAGRQLRSEFETIKATNPHFAERGAEAEDILRRFLNDHLPKRFAASTGLVIDDESGISKQSDVLVYDAWNSPVYRTGSRVLILPSDNVAAVIEVKSTLSKSELQDAAAKIASVKRLKRSPVSDVDQPVTMSPMIMTRCFGAVFAFSSATSLDALAENVAEINKERPSEEWIDLVAVLDVGVVGYAVQMLFRPGLAGWHGGPTEDGFSIPPYYVHLVSEANGELTLNRFFVSLIGHLTFYRRRSAIRFDSLVGAGPHPSKTFGGYQYNLSRQLVPSEPYHAEGTFHGATVKFTIYKNGTDQPVAQVGWIPWQDGAVITYSGALPPHPFLEPFFEMTKTKPLLLAIPPRTLTPVIPLSSAAFIEVLESLRGDFAAKRDDAADDIGWFPKSKEPRSPEPDR